MKNFIIFLLLLPFLRSEGIPCICIDSSLNLAINTDCSDLLLFKISPGICLSDFQTITIHPSQMMKHHFFDHSVSGLPISLIPNEYLQEFPKLHKVVLVICPNSIITNDKNLEFLGLKANNDDYGINNVYFRLLNSTGMSGNTGIYQDFFQKSPVVHEYAFEEPWNFSMKHLNEQFHIFNDEAEYTVFSMKLYSQYCGQIPISIAPAEIELTKENPYTHTLTLLVLKLYFNFSLPGNETFSEFHELFEVCIKNDQDDKSHHILIDRVAKGQGLIQYWNSLLRVNYIGEGDGCGLDSDKWTDVKDGSCDGGLTPCLRTRAAKTNMNIKMNKILRIGENFLLKFRIFNALHNCQHFASDTYDMVNGEKLDFENYEMMKSHSFYSGLEPKLDWIDPVEI